jgi:transcriptional regulator with XRE-family HTH domain
MSASDVQPGTPLGERVTFYRRRLGLSQVELARIVHRSESWLSQVERGARSVDRLSVLTELENALGVSVTDLSPAAPAEERPEVPPEESQYLDRVRPDEQAGCLRAALAETYRLPRQCWLRWTSQKERGWRPTGRRLSRSQPGGRR